MALTLFCIAGGCDYALSDPAFDLPPPDSGSCYAQPKELVLDSDAGSFSTCEQACAALDKRWSGNLCAAFVDQRTCAFGTTDAGASARVTCTLYYPGV